MIVVYIKDATGRRKWGVHKFFWGYPGTRLVGKSQSYTAQTLTTVRYALSHHDQDGSRRWPKASIDRLIKLARKHPVKLKDI